MKRASLLAAGVLAASLLPAWATTVSEVRVDAALDSAETNVLDRWPTIEADLERAVVEALANDRDRNGWIVEIKLQEVSLSGAAVLPEDGEFNTLVGWIYVYPDDNKVRVEEKKITLSAVTGDAPMPANTVAVVLPSDDAFYNALLQAFAQKTQEFVEGI